MSRLAVIGGSGLGRLEGLEITRREVVHTPFGEPSSILIHGTFGEAELVFLARHGAKHTIPPHRVNYRANLWALRQVGVEHVVGVAAVGGITGRMAPRSIVVPDQIIDYTYGREHTLFTHDLNHVTHIDFTEPYCATLRRMLLDAAAACGEPVIDGGTYGATQGPRLETAAEIRRMERDGCDLVGMTGMPEAALARELGLCYASCAVVSNWAAGKGDAAITMREIEKSLHGSLQRVRQLLVGLAGML